MAAADEAWECSHRRFSPRGRVGSVRRRAPPVAGVGVVIVAAYIGGMLLNDVIDQSFDESIIRIDPFPKG